MFLDDCVSWHLIRCSKLFSNKLKSHKINVCLIVAVTKNAKKPGQKYPHCQMKKSHEPLNETVHHFPAYGNSVAFHWNWDSCCTKIMAHIRNLDRITRLRSHSAIGEAAEKKISWQRKTEKKLPFDDENCKN